MLKILQTCPDLYRNSVRNFAGIINPMRTSTRFWLDACNFLAEVILTCHPKHLREALDKITLTDFSFWIKDICLPLETLVHIRGGKFLTHTNFQRRFGTSRLLLAMFQQYVNYVNIINRRENIQNSNALRRFKFDILNHLLMNFPTVEDILNSLNVSISHKEVEGVDVLTHMDVTLDLILILCQENRTFVNITTIVLDFLEILIPIIKDETKKQAMSANKNIKLEMKTIKIILMLFPKALEPQKERFAGVLTSFVNAFVHGEQEISLEAGQLLRDILKNTGIFDSCELEIDLWLESLKFVDIETVDMVTQVFNEVLQVGKAVLLSVGKLLIEKNSISRLPKPRWICLKPRKA